jgi:Penicillin binding protein transpeptidase domain
VKEGQGVRLKEDALPEKYRDHGWFMAFAPVDHPKIAIACIIEHSGHGGSSAGPVVKAVMQKYFEMNPPQGIPVTEQTKNQTAQPTEQVDPQTE